jgi:enoyl-CoA hydratase
MLPNHYSHLQIDHRGEVCWATIHRPLDRNSIDSALMEELERFLNEVEAASVRAVAFIGCGEQYFIGGADGIEMSRCDPSGAEAFSERIQHVFNRMEESPAILAAAINGLCFGGGFEFAMACDLRVAAETARIGLPEVKVGIIPGGGGTQRLARLVGTGRAMEMILSGRLYPAKEALALGLVHRVAPPASLGSEAQALLESILRNPQHALSQAKRAVHAAGGMPFSEGLRVERDAFSRCFEKDFFARLIQKQLKEGKLQTSMKTEDR